MTIPLPEDPKDVRPADTQDPYPHGERCHGRKAHDIHEWSPDDKPHLKLICVGHNLCGESVEFEVDGHPCEAVCSLDTDHDGSTWNVGHWDDVWGHFRGPSDIDA